MHLLPPKQKTDKKTNGNCTMRYATKEELDYAIEESKKSNKG